MRTGCDGRIICGSHSSADVGQQYIEDFTKRQYNGKHLPVRVYTTRGLKDQGKLALDSAHQIIDYFSEVFKIDYPLPKADLLAVHEFVSQERPLCIRAT